MDRWWESPMYCNEWSLWFAWRPVTLLTMEVAWLRFVVRRQHRGQNWHHFGKGDRKWMYANP